MEMLEFCEIQERGKQYIRSLPKWRQTGFWIGVVMAECQQEQGSFAHCRQTLSV